MTGALTRLIRPQLALLNGVTAVCGYLLYPIHVQTVSLSAAFCAVALLAAGGSAINQMLERDLDRLMARTRQRPLPQGRLTPATAARIGGSLIVAGLTLLTLTGGLAAALLGAAPLVWYLAVYTPLKRRTSCALLIGALCGAVPPVIGWFLAGGDLSDYRVVLLAGLLYLWQIPHFWLLQRRHAEEYRSAGIPLFGEPERGSGFMGIWIMALIATTMLLPAFGVIGPHLSAWCTLLSLPLPVMALLHRDRALFSYLNLFLVLITASLIFQ